MSSEEKPPPGLTIDRAAFLLLRVKRAFKKKKQQRKEKNLVGGECKSEVKSSARPVGNGSHGGVGGGGCCRPAPLLRSRTLPAIVAPGLSILQKQIDARYAASNSARTADINQQAGSQSNNDATAIDSSPLKSNNKLLSPRILFTDDALGERRVSESVVDSRQKTAQCNDYVGRIRHGSGNVLGGSQPLTRLAKLLNQRSNYSPDDDIHRRLSWERRVDDSNQMKQSVDVSWSGFAVPRSTSIDSLTSVSEWSVIAPTNNHLVADLRSWNWRRSSGCDIKTEPCSPAPFRRSPSPSQTLTPCQTPLLKVRSHDRHQSLVSSNIGRRIKGHRAIIELQGMEFLEGFGKKKQQQQLSNNQQGNHLTAGTINPLTAQPSLNVHLHALFTAIEYGHADKAKTILESADVDVNSVNSDGLSPLDVAVLGNNKPLVKMLITYGAREGNQFRSPESLGSHLASLMLSAERRLGEVGGSPGTSATSFLEAPTTARASFSAAHNNLTGCGGNAEDKQVALWERRVRTLRKLLLGFDQARPPDLTFLIAVDVIGTKSIVVRFQEAETLESFVCTKFKVQWSIKEDFSVITGEREVLDMKQRECRIDGLVQGQRYYLRACAGNLKGYSRFVSTSPACVTPSSWRDIDGRLPRFAGRLEQLDSLFIDIQRPEYAQDTPAVQRRNHKKKTTIKQLFTATSKFQKSLRRGVYLACLLYHEDKVLVTNEDFLPVIQVDETYPSCIYNDYHWLMKVACTWDNVKTLRQDMEKSHGSSTNHFRLKLLQAAAQMQAALCIQDLGQIYHKPIRDVQGTLVISTVNYVKSPKLVSVLNSRWLPLNKVTKKIIIHEDSNVADILMTSIQDQMTYHQLSSIKLSRGLYMGFIKMQSSVDLIQIVVPSKAPNVLPHCKVRENPHVSAEEWSYLKRITRVCAAENKDDMMDKENDVHAGEQEKLFVDLIAGTSRRLFSYMEISAEDSLIHRLYDAEVIELSDDVSFIIVVPPAESACSVPGTREILLQRGDLLSLPIQVFEMVHLNAYQQDVINRYSKLSCILELDTAQAQHNHREAFSSSEVSAAKDKLTKLQELQTQMNSIWKGARWLIDVITFARDRGSSQCVLSGTTGICMRYLLNIERNNRSNGHSLKRSLLQIPPRDPKLVKSSPGRGSWPGPNVSNSTSNLLTAEFSKSEQQLTCAEGSSDGSRMHLDTHRSNDHMRKGSDTSNLSTGSEPIKSTFLTEPTLKLPPSKSEDTLLLSQYKNLDSISRHGVVTSISASTSPQLGAKSINYGRTLLGVSTTTLTNTTSLLSVTSTNSDSMLSLNSDDYSTVPGSSVNLKSNVHSKSKVNKPTASVAAMASVPMDTHLKDQSTIMPSPMPGILQVYAAYETGLASGTSLKLHVTPRTTAREVVDLVVKQLNMAVVLKGQEGPIYTVDELPNFCLVAVIGARERCLRDDFKPLQLQNPWKKGRLYVRLKQDVLAALEHSSKHTAYL